MKIFAPLLHFKILNILVCISVAACFAHAAEPKIHHVIGCEIFGFDQKLIRKFPGEICLFFPNGNVLSAQEKKLILYNEFNNILWSKPIQAHHQMKFSLDQKNLLAIGSAIAQLPKDKAGSARTDRLLILDLKGEVLRSFDLYENRGQFKKKYWKAAAIRKYPQVWSLSRFKGVNWELTHVNSFYEIPDNTLGNSDPIFKKGNYIVNDISLMLVFVLSADLKKVLWQNHLRPEVWSMLHDVQILANGNLLYYNNGTPEDPQTALIEYNLKNKKIVWQHNRPGYSVKWGGVQLLTNGNILFTDSADDLYSHEIQRDGKIVWSMKSPAGTYLQEVKRDDLTSFLKLNKGL